MPTSALGRGSTAPPSDRITIGVIGAGTREPYESPFYIGIDECEIVAVCDVQRDHRDALKEKLEKGTPRSRWEPASRWTLPPSKRCGSTSGLFCTEPGAALHP